jgi:hypothetical protein
VKKQTFKAYAVVSRRGWLHRQVGDLGRLLFDRLGDAKCWIKVDGDCIQKVRVTIEPIKKPNRKRNKNGTRR